MKLEEWQEKRIDFYQNSGALPFINNFFDVKRGVRCVSGHIKGFTRNDQPNIRRWRNDYTECRAYTLIDEGKYKCLVDNWVNHFFIYVYDKKALEWHPRAEKKRMFIDNIVGMNATFELDSAYIDESLAKRRSFFDQIDEFNDAIYIVTKEIRKSGQDYNVMFSGNGIYIIVEGYYGDKISVYKDNFINQIDNFNEGILGDDLRVHLDNKKAVWMKYFKIPFTGHDKMNRMSIPLSKGKLDGSWIDYMSNLDNIYSDYSLIDEIIKKCEWSKIW